MVYAPGRQDGAVLDSSEGKLLTLVLGLLAANLAGLVLVLLLVL